jgi:hypothetical protein
MDGLTASAFQTEYSGRSSLGRHSLLRKKVNMKLWRPIGIWGIALVGLIILLAPLPAFAQSCALCYTQAASSGSRMIQALRSGILILIAPPTFMSIGVIFVCYHKRNQTRDDADDSNGEWKKDDSSDGSGKDW